MSTKGFWGNFLCVLFMILFVIGAIVLFNTIQNNSQPAVNDIPAVTNAPTNLPVTVTNAPTNPPVATYMPTNSPVVATMVPVVTAVPVVVTEKPKPVIQATATPEVWYIQTYVPATQAPVTVPPVQSVITATPEPVITATPAPVITATPVPTATPEPVITATPVPTATPEPTKIPVTQAPSKYTSEAFETARNELYKLTAGVNEIMPDYTASRKYDLYSYIDFEKTDPYKLFEVLREIYVDTLAHSLDFKFDYGNSVQGIEMTLNSAYCSNCGKVKCIYDRQNDAKMATLLGNVSQNDIMNVNLLLLNFINSNSYASTENINERLIICCSCGN